MLPAETGVANFARNSRMLFTFAKPNTAAQWQTVNDGVMGGRSEGRFRINDEKNLEFFGNLSLANNGGFASVRSAGMPQDLRNGDAIVIKVRGDGREYSLNLYTRGRRAAFSYRAGFQTTKDQWTEVSIPLSEFVATSFGRVIRNAPLNPARVSRLGFLLGDKKAGPFKLEVQSVGLKRAQ